MPSRVCTVTSAAEFVSIPENWKVIVGASLDEVAAESTHLIERISFDSCHRKATGDRDADAATTPGKDDGDDTGALVPVHLALSGGSTPKRIYETFSRTYFFRQMRDKKGDLHLWYGDVRMVADDHADSNAGMVLKALRHSVPPENIHPVDVAADAAAAAAVYSEQLQASMQTVTLPDSPGLKVPVFDLVMLGMGPDGHTCSLFPGTGTADVRDKLCVPCMPGPDVKPQVERVTITAPVIEAARHVVLIATGKEKADAFRGLFASDDALAANSDWMQPVIRLLRRCKGIVYIVADAALADTCFLTQSCQVK